jgi:hypothetical protein
MHSKFIAVVSLLSAVASLQTVPAFGRVNLVAVYERSVTAVSANDAASDVQVAEAVSFGAPDTTLRKSQEQSPAFGEGSISSSDRKSAGDAR